MALLAILRALLGSRDCVEPVAQLLTLVVVLVSFLCVLVGLALASEGRNR